MFNYEAEAEVTLQNTGKVGFKYSIVDPELEVQAGGVKKRLEVLDETDSAQASDLWPGRPTVIPDTVSRLYFSKVFRLFTEIVCVCVCVFMCMPGLHRSWCGAISPGSLLAGCPWCVWEAASAEGGFSATTNHHSNWRGNISKNQPRLADKPRYGQVADLNNPEENDPPKIILWIISSWFCRKIHSYIFLCSWSKLQLCGAAGQIDCGGRARVWTVNHRDQFHADCQSP